MSISESERHQLYQRLEAVLGREEANTLMEHLPPVGWADVATKQDLEHLGQVFDLRLRDEANLLRLEMAGMRTDVHMPAGEAVRRRLPRALPCASPRTAAAASAPGR